MLCFQITENLFDKIKDPLLKAKILEQMKPLAFTVDFRADKAIEIRQRRGKIFRIFNKFFGCNQLLKDTAKTCIQKDNKTREYSSAQG